MKTLKLIILLIILFSCTEDPGTETFTGDDYSIRSIHADGKTREKFVYNDIGKIIESQSFYFCNRFSYDNNRRLVKQEIAVDPDIASSSYHPEKSELMTSRNSTFTGNYIFEYNSAGKLVSQKNYFKKNGQFEYTSMVSLEYEGDRIVRRNLHNAENTITQFNTYEYDNKGNVTNDKYYSFLFITGTSPKLISEVSYKYDDKNNPFIIYKELGQPGLYSNTNNIIESNSILYEDVPGIDKYSTSKTTYTYNDKGFPVKVNNAEEYRYD